MAWTTPKTFLAENGVTASELNVYVRDNMLETEAAKAAAAGRLVVTAGSNAVAAREPSTLVVTAEVSTASTTPVALTGGPSITFTHGGAFIVFFASRMNGSVNGLSFSCGPHVVGGPAGTEAAVARAIVHEGTPFVRYGGHALLSGVTPGAATVEMRYWATSGVTGNYGDRQLTVLPL